MSMPPKKIVSVNESDVVVAPVRKPRTKKIVQDDQEVVKTDEVVIEPVKKTRAKKIVSNEDDKKVVPNEDDKKITIEPVKKTRSKKIVTADIVEPEIIIPSKTTKIQKPDKNVKPVEIIPSSDVLDTIKCDNSTESKLIDNSNSDYNILKTEWSILCEQIIALNKEKDELEIRKNILLNKLWKLGEDTKPKSNNLHTLESIKSVGVSQSKILENNSDSDDSDSSDSSESESESDSDDNIQKPKVVRKSSGKVSDSSDSD
jgi:hypothetical protein